MPEYKTYYPILHIGVHEFIVNEIDVLDLIKICYGIKLNYSSVNLSNKNGYQSPNLSKEKLFFPLISILNKIVQTHQTDPNLHISNLWVNISSRGAYNSIHNHLNPISLPISGVLYLQVPSDSGDFIVYDPIDVNNSYRFSPTPKTLLLFPPSLFHSVEPNLNNKDRISIAFNFS
jgi:hypothetical protein